VGRARVQAQRGDAQCIDGAQLVGGGTRQLFAQDFVGLAHADSHNGPAAWELVYCAAQCVKNGAHVRVSVLWTLK